jgi:hypothetical protein
MNKKSIFSIVAGVLALIVIIAMFAGGVGKNNAQDWQIIQSVRGKITVRDQAGWYLKWFATVWTYPRYVDKAWNDVADEGGKAKESTRTTFNDGGTAQVSTYVRYMTPTSDVQRIEFHRQFAGNIDNATVSVKSHQINCVKATGPLMSASENQSARKAEFTQLIWDQLTDGLYAMKRVEKEVVIEQDPVIVSTTGTVVPAVINTPKPKVSFKVTTELVLDDTGMPTIAKASPLISYGIKILQFSVTGIDYDGDTLKQFSTKKLAYLAAEQSKADREAEKQERFNIIEKGLREVAEAQAAANVKKETAVVAAQLKAEVAEQEKTEALTVASMAKEVADIEKEQAVIMLAKAELDGQAVIVLAEAEKKRIELAGAITELEQAMIEAQVTMADVVSANLAKVAVPMITMGGGGGAGGTAGGLDMNLVNLKLMVDSGILEKLGIDSSVVKRQINRGKATTK